MARKTTSGKPPAGRRNAAKGDSSALEDADTSPDETATDNTEAEGAQPDDESATGEAGETAPAPADADLPADDQSGAERDSETVEDRDAETRDPASPETAHASSPVTTEQVIIRKGGFVPLLIGGLVAGAIGLGGGYYAATGGLLPTTADIDGLRDDLSARIAAQDGRIDALSAQVDATIETAKAPDISGLEQAVAGLAGDLDRVRADLATVGERLDAIEARGAEAGAPAIDGAELAALQEALKEQGATIAALAARAQEADAAASAAAEATLRRAALARLQTALDSGGSLAGAVADLEAAGVAVPEALRQGGSVAALGDLQARFPEAARAALAAARATAAGTGEGGGLTAFLRTQLGARSLEPREGDDPDAILSRAEAAAREGRLRDALAEIDALPEAARAELSDWAGDAARRLEAVAAAQKLSEELN